MRHGVGSIREGALPVGPESCSFPLVEAGIDYAHLEVEDTGSGCCNSLTC